MHPRASPLAHALEGLRQWGQLRGPGQRHRLVQFPCLRCRHNFSSSLLLRKVTYISRRHVATAAKDAKQTKYPGELLIYDAGDMRTTFVSFWKAMALLQFGTCVAFLTPILYYNENQPNKTIRVLQAAGVGVLSTIPSAVLSFLTAPYVRQVYLQVPVSARHSLAALRAFATKMPPTTRLTFQTLRIFPFRKSTSAYLFELRALPPRKFRFANIELPKTKGWRKKQSEKSWGKRLFEILNEPRFKFYVKEGRAYTMRSGVPGVWEEVAKKIQDQTFKEGVKANKAQQLARPIRPARLVGEAEAKPIRRQTARPVTK